MTQPTSETRVSQETRYSEKVSLTQTLLETLGQTGLRPAFREPAAGRTRARRVAGSVAVLLALAAAGFVLLRTWPGEPPAVAGSSVAVLELVRGSVGVLPASAGGEASALLALDAGAAIHAGAVVETGSPATGSGRAAFRLAGGESMRLDAETRVRVTSSSAVELEQGAVYFDSEGAGDGAGVEVRTTLGLVRDIGTQFEVRLLEAATVESLRVRVREGEVVLEHRGESHGAGAGVELAIDAGGTLRRGAVAIHGPDWDWVLETAPAPDIAGRPLPVFLDWVEREGGWTVRFTDVETAELAATTILHGDLEGLTLTEASSMVFQGSGLAYRIAGQSFVVAPAAGDGVDLQP